MRSRKHKNIILSWTICSSTCIDSAIEHLKSMNLRGEDACYVIEKLSYRYSRIHFGISSKLGQPRNYLDNILPSLVEEMGLDDFTIENFESWDETFEQLRLRNEGTYIWYFNL